MLNELAQYIENNTSLTIGSTLFVGTRPASNYTPCVVLYESPGSVHNFDLIDRVDVMLQVVAHNTTYPSARSMAEQVLVLLHGNSGMNLPVIGSGDTPIQVASAKVISGPYSLGFDANQLYSVSVNLLLIIQNQ